MAITTSAKNILWVDIAKFIAMFLVVFEHVVLAFKLDHTSYIAYIRNVIVTFHMPLFFLITFFIPKTYELFLFVILYSSLIYGVSYFVIKICQKTKLDILLGKYLPSKAMEVKNV